MQTNLACSLSLQTNLVYKPNLRSKATPQMKTKEAKAVADEATNEQVASAKDATAKAEAAVQIWPGLATATVEGPGRTPRSCDAASCYCEPSPETDAASR